MKKLLKKVLLVAAMLSLMTMFVGVSALAGPDLHLKLMSYNGDSVLAPGLGLYCLGTTPWGFQVEHTLVGMAFLSRESDGCNDCEDGGFGLYMSGLWDIQIFYDIPVGGCDAGPCDTGHAIRLGAGLGIPAWLSVSTIPSGSWVENVVQSGVHLGASEIGVILSAGYVWPHDWSARGEVYWSGTSVGFGLSLHADVFSIGDWIRGNVPPAEANSATLTFP